VELNPSWESASHSNTEELPRVLWNPKVHFRVHKSRPLAASLSQINPVHTTPSCLSKIDVLSTHLRLGLPSGLFPSGFLTKTLYAFLFSPNRATCPAHFILFNLIFLIIFGKDYKLWRTSLCSFLQPPVTSLFGPNILLSTLFSNTLSLCSSLNVRDQL
jgi:hypothetical protein